jgi:uncharacterized glyoxalase superfamily protein PhnB
VPDPDPREFVPVAPELFVPDVGEAVRFYTDKLGFEILRIEPPGEPGPRSSFAIMARGRAHILFAHERLYIGDPLSSRGDGVDIRVMVDDVNAVYEDCREGGVNIVHDIADRDYGLRDFIISDPNGFRWRFASPVPPQAAD